MDTVQVAGQILGAGLWIAFILAIAVSYVVNVLTESRERRAAERRRVADARRRRTVTPRVPARSPG
jgi:hypothetical protein